MTKSNQANQQPILEEAVLQDDVTVDREAGMIRNCKICSPDSVNKRVYSDKAMLDLSKLYESAPIRIDHGEKGYLKTPGCLINSKYNRTKRIVRADASINRGHPIFEQLMEDAEHRPHLVKFSHEIPAGGYEAHRDRDGRLVIDSVHALDCVALVTKGGLNQSLFEEEEEPMLKTVDDFKSEYPELYEELREACGCEAKTASEKLAKALQERDANATKVEELQTELQQIKAQLEKNTRREEIVKEAEELGAGKVTNELLEALLAVDPENATAILKQQAALREDVTSEEEKTPEAPKQRSGMKAPVVRTRQEFRFRR